MLLIEDEVKLAASIGRTLDRAGFAVDIVHEGARAREILATRSYALIVLDLVLPGVAGTELLASLRERRDQTPVLIISARGTVEERVAGLNSGADDYLVKPFAVEELLARVLALLRRAGDQRGALLTAGDLVMDQLARKVRRGGMEVHLSQREYSLLQYLLRNKNRVVSRRQIAEEVWGYTFDTGTNIVDVYMSYLRKAVDAGHADRLLRTIHGRGFMLADP